LTDETCGSSSEAIQHRVEAARQIQHERFRDSNITCCSEMTPVEVKEFCATEPEAQSLLKTAMKQLYLTARSFHRILKLSRTIADLDESDIIKASHLAEALQYRQRSHAS